MSDVFVEGKQQQTRVDIWRKFVRYVSTLAGADLWEATVYWHTCKTLTKFNTGWRDERDTRLTYADWACDGFARESSRRRGGDPQHGKIAIQHSYCSYFRNWHVDDPISDAMNCHQLFGRMTGVKAKSEGALFIICTSNQTKSSKCSDHHGQASTWHYSKQRRYIVKICLVHLICSIWGRWIGVGMSLGEAWQFRPASPAPCLPLLQ